MKKDIHKKVSRIIEIRKLLESSLNELDCPTEDLLKELYSLLSEIHEWIEEIIALVHKLH